MSTGDTVNKQVSGNRLEILEEQFSRKLDEFVTGEIDYVIADFKLLEKMNKATSERLEQYCETTADIAKHVSYLNTKYAALKPYLEQIDVIEEKISVIEKAAMAMDAYSKQLEQRYKDRFK